MNLTIFCDFDETITRTNVTDSVLEQFADPIWLQIQEEWLAGTLSARGVLEEQMPLVTVSQRDLNTLIDSIEVDPFFAEFALSCTRNNDSLYIISDGFDYWIERILRRAFSAYDGAVGKIPVFACNLKLHENRFAISFPYYPEGCIHGCATCKPTLVDRLKASADKTVIIGDGASDCLLAKGADFVLAKDGLREYCVTESISYQGFRNFRDVTQIINAHQEKV